jgi:hypothetical protein
MNQTKYIRLLDLSRLKGHEKTSPARNKHVRRLLLKSGSFTKPIIVDKASGVILDGHHRVFVLRKLGCRKIPALAINYRSAIIKVNSRRKNYKVTKEIVLSRARKNRLFPYKTTKHLLKANLPRINFSFNQLKK